MFHIIIYGIKDIRDRFAENLGMTLKSIKDHFYFPHNLTVITPEETLLFGVKADQLVSKYLIRYETTESVNIPEAINTAIQNSGVQTKYILIMAVGMILDRHIDQKIHQTIRDKNLGGAAFKIVDRNDLLVHAGNDKNTFPFTRYYLEKDRNSLASSVERVSLLPMEFMLLRRDAFNIIGNFSVDHPQFGWNIEWCKRAGEKKQALWYISARVMLMAPINAYAEKYFVGPFDEEPQVPVEKEELKEEKVEPIAIKKRGRPSKKEKAYAH